jgi:hypothetical protein
MLPKAKPGQWTIYPVGNVPSTELHTKTLLWIWIRTGFDKLDLDPGWQK